MKYKDLRDAFIKFYTDKDHVVIESSPVVLQGDATTLFNSSGMQPLVPYLAGEETHKDGTRLVDIQACIRTGDIDEVGDNRHETGFEMMGNWSLGEYFKEEQIPWMWELYTKVFGLDPARLFVTVFAGNEYAPRDEESADIWKSIGVPEDHIFYYGEKSNWWSRSGAPSKMPIGEIGGPSTELFYDFEDGPHDGPDSDEERFIELGNSVFITYKKVSETSFEELSQKNVDFGGGLERTMAAINHTPDVFLTPLFTPTISAVESLTDKSYSQHPQEIRIIADHMRAALFILDAGVVPSNKEHGYVLRRLLRRSAVQLYRLTDSVANMHDLSSLIPAVIDSFEGVYFAQSDSQAFKDIVNKEMKSFAQTLEKGMKKIQSMDTLSGTDAFDLFQSYGFPFEITQEIAQQKGLDVSREDFDAAMKEHRELSKTASAGKFKGGLADTSNQVIKYHTATHLIHQALKDVFGDTIRQEGSNITQERLRFDFKLDAKPTDEDIARVENIVNEKIAEALPVRKVIMKKAEAEKIGASAFFRDKYEDEVSVYYIGSGDIADAYSKEFCGGPHVENTQEIGTIKIFKVKKIGGQLVRLYAS